MCLGNKDVMAKNIRRFMEENQKTRVDMCRDLNIKYTTLTDWLKAKTYPRIDKIEQMADYFGVTKSDLVEAEVAKESISGKKYYFSDEAAEFAQEVFEDPERRVLFDASRDLSKEDFKMAVALIERLKGTNPDA